jgi:hypothetical protein
MDPSPTILLWELSLPFATSTKTIIPLKNKTTQVKPTRQAIATSHLFVAFVPRMTVEARCGVFCSPAKLDIKSICWLAAVTVGDGSGCSFGYVDEANDDGIKDCVEANDDGWSYDKELSGGANAGVAGEYCCKGEYMILPFFVLSPSRVFEKSKVRVTQLWFFDLLVLA